MASSFSIAVASRSSIFSLSNSSSLLETDPTSSLPEDSKMRKKRYRSYTSWFVWEIRVRLPHDALWGDSNDWIANNSGSQESIMQIYSKVLLTKSRGPATCSWTSDLNSATHEIPNLRHVPIFGPPRSTLIRSTLGKTGWNNYFFFRTPKNREDCVICIHQPILQDNTKWSNIWGLSKNWRWEGSENTGIAFYTGDFVKMKWSEIWTPSKIERKRTLRTLMAFVLLFRNRRF
jgi:hypothetical protein